MESEAELHSISTKDAESPTGKILLTMPRFVREAAEKLAADLLEEKFRYLKQLNEGSEVKDK